ncbi:GNAT family N-acetyltransferase [Salinibius halmophilus]|uniref:GNAT family N-acetyltransferase n=1 Tax=Salinibius halmophilus TaxID=1853216 RepID=UPI000E664A5B|nr:GNAT family N-acetyltransferase [Salinibius halmophilus]
MHSALLNYFKFNNARTLTTGEPSQLAIHQFDHITALVDPTRQFDNQVIIHDACDNEEVVEALVLYQNSFYPEVRIAPSAQALKLGSFLSNSDFHYMYDIDWLVLLASDYQAGEQTSIRVERWQSAQVDDFRALLKTSGVQCADDIWQQKRVMYCTEQFRCFVAYIEDQPVAWATSFIDDSHTAILANAFTQPLARNKGCHTALLHARIQDAIALGCTTILSDVMPESTSAENCKKVGFVSQQVDMVWVK